MMIPRTLSLTLAIFWTLATYLPAATTTQTQDVLAGIERLAAPGGEKQVSLPESVVDGIENNPAAVSQALLPKLSDKKIPDQQLAVYVWALGLTKDSKAIEPIIALHRQSKSELVQGNCLRALAMIGGKKAEAHLLSTLDTTTNKDMRFNILNLLGQLQCEAALPKTEEVLKASPDLGWQSIFVFGKMGDKAVPFLLRKINDKDRNTRGNSISALGQWILASEAALSLPNRYWQEEDTNVRMAILVSMERVAPDLSSMQKFFEQVVAREKDKSLLEFAHETVGNMDKLKEDIQSFSKKKKPSASGFNKEWTSLYKSCGKKGDYEVLAATSVLADEPKLKTLRERILQRDSDEAFYDYQKVNDIIIRNRFAVKLSSATQGK